MALPPLLCLSHVEWSSVSGHPSHLMTWLARERRVFVLERSPQACRLPLLGAARAGEVTVLTPYLPAGTERAVEAQQIAPLLEAVLEDEGIAPPILWVCDAQSLPVADSVRPAAIVYDCPWGLEYAHDRARAAAESAILRQADVVVVHAALDQARLRASHPQVHLMPDGGGMTPWSSSCALASRVLDELRRVIKGGRVVVDRR